MKNIIISRTKEELGSRAAEQGSKLINEAISKNDHANIIVATGASQFEMLSELVKKPIDWSKVTGFHLDEYIGIPISHPASFRKYLKERFVDTTGISKFYYINGESDPTRECDKLGNIISDYPIDVAFVGIGENSHLAFNDPPADFETTAPYIVVNLDANCKKQQMGEGWFADIAEIPNQAISMSIKQIMKSKNIICSVPDKRKAWAVKASLENEITPQVPASVLQLHTNIWIYLDNDSAYDLQNNPK